MAKEFKEFRASYKALGAKYGLTEAQMAKLTIQDVIDAREIQGFEEIAKMREIKVKKPAGKNKVSTNVSVSASSSDNEDSSFEEGFGVVRLRDMAEEKPYLQMDKSETGDLRLSLYIPPYNLDDLKDGYKEKLTMFFSKRKLDQMEKKFGDHNLIVVYIDGACISNPGPASGAACFFGRTVAFNEHKKADSREDNLLASSSSDDEPLSSVDLLNLGSQDDQMEE